MTLYYVYERDTGKYAGSGVFPINTDTHASTTTPIPHEPPEPEPVWVYDPDEDVWIKQSS